MISARLTTQAFWVLEMRKNCLLENILGHDAKNITWLRKMVRKRVEIFEIHVLSPIIIWNEAMNKVYCSKWNPFST